MPNEPWDLVDGPTGTRYSAAQASAWLIEVLSDPEKCEHHWDALGDIDIALQVTAVLCNPQLAERMWDSLSDNLKFSVIIATPERDAATIRAVAHDVVAASYCEEA
jgi:hypothetical protein